MAGVKVLTLSLLATFSSPIAVCAKPEFVKAQSTSNVLAILLSVDESKSTKTEDTSK